jgi:hypothetical protein
LPDDKLAKLCAVCTRMFEGEWTRKVEINSSHHRTHDALVTAANEGCYICGCTIRALRRCDGGWRCSGTRYTELLPALAGLAKTIAANTGDRYVAGMWERDLLFQLQWRLNPSEKETPTDSNGTYVAPSWSWVSRAATIHASPYAWLVEFEKEDSLQLAEITSIDLQYATDDIYGRLRGGSLRIQAVPIAAKCNPDGNVEIEGCNKDRILPYHDDDECYIALSEFILLPLWEKLWGESLGEGSRQHRRTADQQRHSWRAA